MVIEQERKYCEECGARLYIYFIEVDGKYYHKTCYDLLTPEPTIEPIVSIFPMTFKTKLQFAIQKHPTVDYEYVRIQILSPYIKGKINNINFKKEYWVKIWLEDENNE